MPEDNYKLPCLSRHDFSVLIDDILALENYSIDENAQTSRNQLKHNLIISCLIAQNIVCNDNVSPKTIEKLQTKFKLEVFRNIECTKKNLNKLPKLLQLPFLISRSYLTSNEIAWAKIAIYFGIILRHHKLKTYSNRIIHRIKVACFFQTPIKTWILKNLPNIGELYNLVKSNPLQINHLIEYFPLCQDSCHPNQKGKGGNRSNK